MNLTEKLKNFEIIDSHMHLGIAPNVLYYNYSDDRVVEIQKAYNVKISICSHCIGFYDLSLQIEEINKAAERFGEFFYWNLVYNPKKASESLKIIEANRLKINFAEYPDVYLDFSGDTIYPPVFKMVIEKLGKGRILFGTDMPMMDIRYHVASVLAADITNEERKDIFYNTAAKLYGFY